MFNAGMLIMRRLTIGLIGLVRIGVTGLALANPAQLLTHPRHPSRGEFAYDRGQQTLTAAQALRDAAESENSNIVQQLEDSKNPKLLWERELVYCPLSKDRIPRLNRRLLKRLECLSGSAWFARARSVP